MLNSFESCSAAADTARLENAVQVENPDMTE